MGVRHLGMNRAILILLSLLLMSCTSIYKAATGTYAYYKIHSDNVEYYSWNPMSENYYIKQLSGADSVSFEQITTDYGKDINFVFRKSNKIESADPKTFKLINDYYALDKKSAYFIGIAITDSDPKTFSYLGNSWSRDNNNYFYKQNNIHVCDIKSFKLAPDKFPSRGYDNHCYFVERNKVAIKDMATLEILPANYAKDKFHVYWGTSILKGADPKTFLVKDNRSLSIAKDKKQCYSATQVLSCNDLNPKGQRFCGCSE